MFDTKYLKNFESRIIESNSLSPNRDFIRSHYKVILQMANPIILDKKIILNDYQYRLLMHLFTLCTHVEYIPSFFVKEIAEMSFHLQTLEIEGIFHEIKSSKKTEFLSQYYKIISFIMKNKHIKQEKKAIIEKIISQNLTENTVKWLIQHFTQPNVNMDSKAKIMLKSITQTKFEFFETFAVSFKKTIYDLITSTTHSQDKPYLNKYVFKIIEKCLIKLNNIEKEFLVKLNKISHNIIDLFLKTKSKKLTKLFRRSLRIVYIIYDRNGYSNSKIIKLFKSKFFPLIEQGETNNTNTYTMINTNTMINSNNVSIIDKKFITKVLWDFVEVNFSILKKKVDLLDYYHFFYSLLINEDKETSNKLLSSEVANLYFEEFLFCLEKLFKYEMSLARNQIFEISYIKLLHNLFNMFYSEGLNTSKKQISIEIICRIVRNCENKMKISILEEISFSHISFFMEESNCGLLENLISSIIQNVKTPGIYDYFIKYLDVLYIHAMNGNYKMLQFLEIFDFLADKIENERIFFLILGYCKKFFLQIQEDGVITNINLSPGKIKEINGFLRIIAMTSHTVPQKITDKNVLQDILNIYSSFLMVKIFNFPQIDYNSKFKLENTKDCTHEDINDFSIYFLILAKNLPVLIFNKNSLLTSPVKIELNYNVLNRISDREKKKLISDEFEDFGENTKKWIRDLDKISQLYLLGIYISFIAKYILLKIYFSEKHTTDSVYTSQKDILRSKIDLDKIATEKISIVNMLDYLTDNLFLYDSDMNELFSKIFDKYMKNYLNLLKNHHNTLFKQKLLSHDLMNLLNYSCFYHENVREVALNLIKIYAENFPFLLNEYEIFEYYVTVLGMLVSNSLQPYDFFIKRININRYSNDKNDLNVLELPSEKYFKEQIYLKLSHIFEKCLQKSHIINNNNISYNIANYVNKCTMFVSHTNLLERDELNYSINLLQKIYNNIKKVEIPSFLKTTAYLDPKKFQDYLKENVYKNFDKYISISAIDDISNFTDYAKSTILQIRNKYMGIIEGKINNLKINFKNDNLFENYKNLFTQSSNEEVINSYCYYKIMNDNNLKIQKIFDENDLKQINQNIFPIMVELTSFIVYADMNDFKTTFNKDIITDEIINLITCIPIFLANSTSIEAGCFCWEWILYYNKKKLTSLLNNIILSVKYLKMYKANFLSGSNASACIDRGKSHSDIFDIEDNLEEMKSKKFVQFEQTTLTELNNKLKFAKKRAGSTANAYYTSTTGGFYINSNSNSNTQDNLHFINLINEKVLSAKDIDPNDYINSQITLLKFLKECMNEFCKCDIEKLLLILQLIKQYVDLSIDEALYSQPAYIYLHFFIFNISIELIDIIEAKMDLFPLKNEELLEFKLMVYLFGFRYFEFDKKRRMITNVVQLSEIEQTLINCVEMIFKDRNKKEAYDKIKQSSGKKVKKKNKLLSKVYTFVYSIESSIKENSLKNGDSFLIYDNVKDLLIYLIESEINNLRYWNSPSTFHSNKKYTPSSSKLKEEKVKDIFLTAFSISNKLSIKLVQRYPWIEKKFHHYILRLGTTIYQNRKLFYHQPQAMKYLIDHIIKNKTNELSSDLSMIKDLIMWKYPSLNYALKYLSFAFNSQYVLHKYSILLLHNTKISAIIFYMPQLIQSIRTDTNHTVEKYILEKCKKSCRIAHQFLWSLEVEEVTGPKAKTRFLPKGFKEFVYEVSGLLRVKILKDMNPMQRKFWHDENNIFSKITEVSSRFIHLDENPGLSLQMTKEEKTDFVREELSKLPKKMPSYIYLPTNPDWKILEILPNSAVTLQSAKKVPFIVSFIGVSYNGPDNDYIATSMNISEYISNELLNYEYLVRFGSIEGGNLLLNGVNSMEMSKMLVNKSTQFTQNRLKDNQMIRNITTTSNNNYNSENMLMLEDDPFLYDEQEDMQNLTVPHIEIKIFGGKNEINDYNSNLVNGVDRDNNGVVTNINMYSPRYNNTKENLFTFNINDLSDCTDDENDADLVNLESTNRHGKNTRTINFDTVKLNGVNNYSSEKRKENYSSNKTLSISCIFKVGDDLRQDSLALQVIHIFQEIFRENNLNLYVYPYQTISTLSSKHKDLGGFIEVVQDCNSRDQIGKTYDTNLYDYFICTFGQENSAEFREARKNFVESLAAYAIISYILQIKDRHNGNILIDKYGHIIHIDFGFIFDISPANNMKFEKAAFKLTKEMIKIMQGTGTEPYATFVDLTIRGFLACRDYMEKLLDPVVLMFNSGLDCFMKDSIKNFIDRFKLELNEDEAAVFMRNLIENAEDNWRTNAYDYIQKKQQKISY